MAIKILTLEEAEMTRKRAQHYGETFVMVTIKAKQDYHCDNSGALIPAGTECAGVLLLPDEQHPNFEHQKKMLDDYAKGKIQ